MSGKFKIVVISLIGSSRRERVASNLNSLGVSWSFFDAARSPLAGQPTYNESKALSFWGRGLSDAEIGCAASHIAVLTDLAAETELSWVLVIEDDVILDHEFNYEALPALCSAGGIEYLRLHARQFSSATHIAWVGQRELIRFKRAPMGTQAYLISNKAARRFVAAVQFISRPIDWEMDRFWANSLANYAMFPFPCFELTLPSSVLKASQTTKRPTQSDRLKWFLWKSKEFIARFLSNCSLIVADRRVGASLAQFKGQAWYKPRNDRRD